MFRSASSLVPARSPRRLALWRPGQRVALGGQIGRVWLEERLGAGATAQIYRVTGGALRGSWALKKLRDAALAQQEHGLMRRARGPFVLGVGPKVTLRDGACFLLEYAPLGALDEILLESRIQGRPLPLTDRLTWLQQLAEALITVHRAGVVHGDVTLKNVMLTEAPGGLLTAKLGDFGMASLGPATSGGTLVTLAPEALDGGPQTQASDMFSLGCCLYACVVGIEPFYDDDERTVAAALKAQRRSVLPADFVSILELEGLAPSLARALGELAERLLHVSPQARPSAADTASQLSALLGRHMG